MVGFGAWRSFWVLVGLVWWNLGGILGILGQIWGSENGLKMGFSGWG